MTTLAGSATAAPQPSSTQPRGAVPLRLIRAELLKIWTTNAWWILAICSLAATALALLINMLQAHYEIDNARHIPDFTAGLPADQQPSQAELDQMKADWLAQNDIVQVLLRSAANIFTSGQYFGLLIVMIIGTLIITNEFFHQTATTTFLATPRRTEVIVAKLAAAIGIAGVFWLFTTVIDLIAGSIFFAAEGETNGLGEWDVQRAILLSLPAYAIWAVFGIGIGVLIRSQIGATLTGAGLYLIAGNLAQIAFYIVHEYWIKKDWVLTAMVFLPSMASAVMISPTKVWDQSPPAWVGAVVLISYGVVAGVVGTLITRKRDIS